MPRPESSPQTSAESFEEPNADLVLDKEAWRQRAEAEFHEAQTQHEAISVIFVDVNYFKSINDTLGHEVGDDVINDMRGLMNSLVHGFRVINTPGQERSLDVVAASEARVPVVNGEPVAGHIGGDEFAAIAKTDTAGAEVIAQRLRDIFNDYINDPANPDRSRLRELDIGLAIGVGTLDEKTVDFADLLRSADKAMFDDKLDHLGLDEHQKKGVRLAASVFKAYGIRIRDVPKIIRLHPELFEE